MDKGRSKNESSDIQFGPSEFVCYVSFNNGVVERIQMGGYGD
jgi:hypothetical protein